MAKIDRRVLVAKTLYIKQFAPHLVVGSLYLSRAGLAMFCSFPFSLNHIVLYKVIPAQMLKSLLFGLQFAASSINCT